MYDIDKCLEIVREIDLMCGERNEYTNKCKNCSSNNLIELEKYISDDKKFIIVPCKCRDCNYITYKVFCADMEMSNEDIKKFDSENKLPDTRY